MQPHTHITGVPNLCKINILSFLKFSSTLESETYIWERGVVELKFAIKTQSLFEGTVTRK